MSHPALRLTREAIRSLNLRRLFIQIGFLTVLCWLTAATAFGQAVNDYRSAATGNWNAVGTWQRFNGTSWVAAVSTPTSASGVITIRSPHNVTVTVDVTVDQVTIESGGTVTITSGDDWTIANGTGTDLTVDGTVTNSGLIIPTGTIQFNSGSTYNHNQNGGTIPTATWNANSTCSINGMTSTDPSGDGQAFGNLTYNSSGMSGNRNMAGSGLSIAGNLQILNTGSGELRMSQTPLTVSGNLTVNDDFRIGSGTARTLNVLGNVSITGGTLEMADSDEIGTMNVSGDFSVTGGTLTESGSASGAIIFNGSGTQTYTSGGTVSNTINFTVNSGSTLQMAAAATVVGGGGTFTLSSGATLGIRSTVGITTSGASGNIQVTGTRTYATGASYIYNGSANQAVGNGLTQNTPANLTIANTGGGGSNTVTLGAAVTMTGNLTISSGVLDVSASNFAINIRGNWTNDGTFTQRSGTVTFNGTAAQTIGGANSTTFNNLTINNTAVPQPGVTLGIDTTVGGTLTLTTDLSSGDNALTHTGGATACSGAGDLVGIVTRTTIAVGTTYCFGNSLNTIQFNSGTPSSPTMTVTLVKGSLPGNISGAVNRLYTLEPTGMTAFSATVQLRYLQGELGAIPESNLKLWRDTTGTGNWVEVGGTVNVTNDYVNVAGVTAFSPWVFAPPAPAAPTAVRMRGVQTVATADGVELRWRTGHEVNNLGFRIYREENGQRTLITKNIIAGSSLAVGRRATLTTGRSYRWTDEDGSANSAYWLEDIDLNGTHTLHGPFTPLFGAGASQNKGGKKSNRSNPNSNSSQNSITLEAMSRQAAQEIRATHEVTPVGALPGSYLGTAVRNAKAGGPKDSAETSVRMLGGERAVKLTVKQEGWYRVMQPELLAAGLDPQANPRHLKLYVDGREVPIQVNGGEDGRFDPADSVEFYGMGLDTPVTDARVYWLLSDRGAGARVREQPQVNGAPAGSGFMQTVERRDRETYMATLLNGAAENFFGAIVTPTEALDQTLMVPSVDRSAPTNATLEIALQGITTGAHVTGVILNGVPLGSVNFNGQAQGVQRFTVPQTQVLDGVNTVTLQNAADDSDYSLVAYLRLTYPRAYRADSDALTLNVQSFQRVTINGFTDKGVRVFDVTDERNVVELETVIKQDTVGFSVTTTPQGTGQRRLMALCPSRLLIPSEIKANAPSNWLTKGNRADLLLITHNTLAAQFSPLVALRRSQGWRVETVDIEDVYDEISFGHKTASGLSDFLAFTATFWNGKPKYVLLGGDASYDPRNYTNSGNSDLVPTRLVDAGTLETASDDALVDFDGDGLPDLTVGRLPARTPAEAQRMVERLVNYDKAAISKETVLVADQNIGYNFESLISGLQAQVPIGQTATTILRSQNNDTTTHANLMAALNRGPRLANYFGHGSFDLWNGDILTVADAAALQNGNKHSVYLMMTCLTGYFLEPGAESLAEALLKNTGGGAIAVWAGTGYTEPDPQEVMNKSVFPNLFKPGQLLGDVLRQAKSATSDRDTRLTWIFFGDPTMRLR